MKSLLDVKTLGAIAAEDDDLRRYFVSTPVYAEIMEGERQVVVGRKGSGKTALFKAIRDQAAHKGYFARGLSFQQYPWKLHYAYESTVGDRYERFRPSWAFLIMLEIFKRLLADPERATRYPNASARDALRAVERFIENNWGETQFDYKKTFPMGGFRLDGVALNPQAAGFGLGGVNIARDGAGLGEQLERLNEWLWTCLRGIGAAAPTVYVLFDELDLGFEPSNDAYLDRVTGLLLATRAVSRALRDELLPFRVVVFLRSDVYDCLHFGDKNKLNDANVSFLYWNAETQYHGCSLKELIDRRIREELDLADDVGDPWSCLFTDGVMRGTQHKLHHTTSAGKRWPIMRRS